MNSKPSLFPASPTKNSNNSNNNSGSPTKIRHSGSSGLNSIGSRLRSPLKTPYFLPTSSLLPSASSPNKQPLACHNVVKRRRGNSVRRTLFGKPDPTETSNWLEELSNKIMNENIEKWGFDFRNDKPLENSKFEYEAIDVDNVPKFYRPSEYPASESTATSSSTSFSNQSLQQQQQQQLSPRKTTLRNASRYLTTQTTYSTTKTSIEIQRVGTQTGLETLLSKKACRSPLKNPQLLSPSKIRKSNSSPATHKTPKKKLCS